MFMIQLLGSMDFVVEYPVMVRVHNVGAIFMSKNITSKCHTNVENGVLSIVFVKLADNDSNIVTNNLSAELHEKHSRTMVGEKP